MATAAQELAEGRSAWFISLGTSMTPAVKAVQRVHPRPVRPREVLIEADRGRVNGWTPRSAVFGVLS